VLNEPVDAKQAANEKATGTNTVHNKQSVYAAYLLGDLDWVHKVHVETIAKLDDSGSDLVKSDALLASWNSFRINSNKA
jgi:hypothetical protein